VALDRERCIQCSRCTRFADEVAGDAMIDFVGRADQTEVNTFPQRPFTSNFSGNIVQICPVGALTATPYRFRARPWDLDVVESTWNEALDAAAQGLARVRDSAGPDAIAVLGGARLPNEDAYAWAKFAKGVLGTDNVDCQLGDGLPAEVVLGLPRATIDEACA